MRQLRALVGPVLLLVALSIPALADGNMETPPAPTPPPAAQDGNMETPPLTAIVDALLSGLAGIF